MLSSLLPYVVLTFLSATPPPGLTQWNPGRRLTAAREITILSSLPRGLFCIDGPPIGTIKEGERVRILAYREISCALFVRHQFLQVRRLDTSVPEGQSDGYVKDVNKSFFHETRE